MYCLAGQALALEISVNDVSGIHPPGHLCYYCEHNQIIDNPKLKTLDGTWNVFVGR